MSSATPIRPGSSDRNLMIIVSVATIAVVVFVIAIIWAFFAGGYAHALVNWMYETVMSAPSCAMCSKACCCWSSCCCSLRC